MINAYIITMSDNTISVQGCDNTRIKAQSYIVQSKNSVRINTFEATQPIDIYKHIQDVFGKQVVWSWPTRTEDDGYCLYTGLYKRTYQAADQNKVVACALSHYRLWKLCAESNEPIMVLEHDAEFFRDIDISVIMEDNKWGSVGLNDPRGNTRKGQLFHAKVAKCGDGINRVPTIDEPTDLPLPMGLAGNSAYLIRPAFAKKLLAEVARIGMWPNDAVMCRQLFPELKVLYPYATKVRPMGSTTTS